MGGISLKEERCPTCGSLDVVDAGPITLEGSRLLVTVADGKQCTLCGHLEIMIPQMVLVKLYPPNVRYLTSARRGQLQLRLKARRRQSSMGRIS